MHKIQYRPTHTAKQVFILTLLLYTLLRFVIILQIIFYKIPKYYEATNIPLTLLLYAVLFIALIALFRGHTFCGSVYDERGLTYTNRLLRKSRSMEFSRVKTAVFDIFGVKFYDTQNPDPKTDKPFFFLPFFRDGIVQVLQIDRFYKEMKAREDVRVIKNFTVLPGYSNRWKIVAILYGFLAVVTFMSCATPITLIVVLFQSH